MSTLASLQQEAGYDPYADEDQGWATIEGYIKTLEAHINGQDLACGIDPFAAPVETGDGTEARR